MDRFSLTDSQWEKMQPFGVGKPGDPGRTGGDARLFVEAVLWIVRTGSPWRDLPPWFGKWNSVYKRFRDWVKAGVFRSNTQGAIKPLKHKAATKVVMHQCPCGTAATKRSSRGAGPRTRVMFVLVQVSSMKISRPALTGWFSRQ